MVISISLRSWRILLTWCGIATLLIGCSRRTPPQHKVEAKSAPKPLVESSALAAGYVGPEVCGRCHADQFDQVMGSAHYRTCRIPEPATMPGGFDPGRNHFTTDFPGLRFAMMKNRDEFFQTTIRTSPSGDEERVTSRIDFILGAGTADDVYLTWRDDGRMYELPMAWLHTADCWGTSHFDPYSGGDCSRPLTVRCLECHNTWFDYVPGSLNQYNRSGYLLGVSCERCHGPGREHVAYHETHPDEVVGHAIVQPASLERERQIEVCTQCHSNAIIHLGPAFSYRPGQVLDQSYRTILAGHTEDDHVANQIKYLRQSKCFQQSEMTCNTCHQPHRKQDQPDLGVKACFDCHEAAECTDRDHLPIGVREQCIECHMPKYLKINVNFRTKDDNYVPPIRRFEHRIAVHPVARKEVLLEWHRSQDEPESTAEAARLTRQLVEHWHAEAEKCKNEYRYYASIAALREALRLQPSEETRKKLEEAVALESQYERDWIEAMNKIRRQEVEPAIALLKKILKTKPDDAKAYGRLGTLYAQSGQMELARTHLEAVSKYDPDSPYGHGMLGWLAFLEGRSAEAIEHYLRAEKVEPYDAKLNFQVALALLQLDQVPDAIVRLRRSLEIDPTRLDACQHLIGALRRQGLAEEAIPVAKHAVELTGRSNLDVLMTLAECFSDAKRYDEAIENAKQALALAEANQKLRVPDVERKLAEYRSLKSAEVGETPRE